MVLLSLRIGLSCDVSSILLYYHLLYSSNTLCRRAHGHGQGGWDSKVSNRSPHRLIAKRINSGKVPLFVASCALLRSLLLLSTRPAALTFTFTHQRGTHEEEYGWKGMHMDRCIYTPSDGLHMDMFSSLIHTAGKTA